MRERRQNLFEIHRGSYCTGSACNYIWTWRISYDYLIFLACTRNVLGESRMVTSIINTSFRNNYTCCIFV